MKKIAREQMAVWFEEGWKDYWEGFWNVVMFGVPAYGLAMAPWFVVYIFNLTGPLGSVVSFLTMIFFQGIITAGLCGVALGRLHGRESDERDFAQDIGVHMQSVMTEFMSWIFAALAAGILGLPGIALMAPGYANGQGPLIAAGWFLFLGAAIPSYLAVRILTLYAIPLVVDKRYDFLSAIRISADCVRRDFMGVMMFFLILKIAYLFAGGIISMVTCTLGLIMLMPVYETIRMRSYRDYFGLDEDRYRPDQVVGVSSYGEEPPTYSYERSARDEQLEAAAKQSDRAYDEWKEKQARIRREAEEKLKKADEWEVPDDTPVPPPPGKKD